LILLLLLPLPLVSNLSRFLLAPGFVFTYLYFLGCSKSRAPKRQSLDLYRCIPH
jgi:hypothetical protein